MFVSEKRAHFLWAKPGGTAGVHNALVPVFCRARALFPLWLLFVTLSRGLVSIMLLEKFCRINYDSYEDFYENFHINVLKTSTSASTS